MTSELSRWDGLTAEQEAEVWASIAAYERTIFWQFVRLLLWGKYSKGKGEEHALEYDYDSNWRKYSYRALCLLAIIFGRGYSNKDKSYHYDCVGWVNNYRTGYEWGCDTLSYNPKTFRYQIGRDGESTY